MQSLLSLTLGVSNAPTPRYVVGSQPPIPRHQQHWDFGWVLRLEWSFPYRTGPGLCRMNPRVPEASTTSPAGRHRSVLRKGGKQHRISTSKHFCNKLKGQNTANSTFLLAEQASGGLPRPLRPIIPVQVFFPTPAGPPFVYTLAHSCPYGLRWRQGVGDCNRT